MKTVQNKDVLGKMIEKDNELKVLIRKLHKDSILPTRGTPESAGFDVYAYNDAMIGAGHNDAIHTGISIAIPDGYVGLLFVRSGLAIKQKLRPTNCVGVIDSDYRGEVILNLYNDNCSEEVVNQYLKVIHKGDRVGQIVIIPYVAPTLLECDNLPDTIRGEGGFGSTGK